MVILDKPFVSEELKAFLEQSQVPVLENACGVEAGKGRRFRFLDEAAFVSRYRDMGPERKLFTVSENSLDWIDAHLDDAPLRRAIAVMKDKAAFRRLVASLYPDFFFREMGREALEKTDVASLPFPFVLKPSVGFFSVGVHTVRSGVEWLSALDDIRRHSGEWASAYPDSVVGRASFILEEYIDGDEYAIDAYYDDRGKAVVLNVFRHEFASASDVGDRLYYTSRAVIEERIEPFTTLLDTVNRFVGARNFPVHVEVRVKPDGRIVPVEFNPVRFAGWCCTDLSHFAWGFRTYDFFLAGKKPDWRKILAQKEDELYTMIVLDKPAGLTPEDRFDADRLQAAFRKVLHFRDLSDDPACPVFGFLFTETDAGDRQELEAIMASDLTEFLTRPQKAG